MICRRSLVLLLVLLLTVSFALHADSASGQAVVVSTLEQRTYLDEGWLTVYGDDESFSDPSLDDSAWKPLKLPLSGYPLNADGSHYVWFRMHFRASEALSGQPFGLFMNKLPDSAEIFCNGSLIGTSGRMPVDGYYGIDTIPRSFLIPERVLNYGGDNVLSIRIYSERKTGDLKNYFFTNNTDRLETYQFEFFFNPQLGMIITLISIFAAMYFLIMFIRQTSDRFNLYLCIGSLFFALYYTSLFIESLPLSFVLVYKIQMASLHIGVCLYAFYFQDFFRFHSRTPVKLVFGGVITVSVLLLFFAKDLAATVFMNNSILYLFITVPLLFYMLYISIIQLLKKKEYALLLFLGVFVVIATGVHDMIYAVLGLQPRFWLNGWGMIAFLLTIFLTSANRFMDIKIAAERESLALVEKTRKQMLFFEKIHQIGMRMGSSGTILSERIREADSASAQVAVSNRSIEERMQSQIRDIEENNTHISRIIDSFEEVAHFVDEQAALVEQSSASVTELTASISRVNQTALHAKEATGMLTAEAEKSRRSVEAASVAITEINESAGAVRDIVNVIGDIASTINLLGMNASIEAAHAGQFGRGFSVVANEIRKLSEQTAASSRLIMAKIEEMVAKTGRGQEQFMVVRGELERMLDGIGKTDGFITHISRASEEQDNNSKELLTSVQSMLGATQNVKSRSERQRSDTERIRQAIRDIQQIFHAVSVSTDELSKGGKTISEVMENMKAIAAEHREIQRELDGLLSTHS